MTKQVIIYARKPEAGKSKTRLGARIGHQQAAGVYARILFTYLGDLIYSNELDDVQFILSVADEESFAFFKAAYPEFRIAMQVSGTIGERMKASFDEAFSSGAKYAVLTGSDVPLLDAKIVSGAFERLEQTQVVFGPAEDGGYFLIGMRYPGWNVFQNIPWSTGVVLEKTMELGLALGLQIELMQGTFDLDTVEEYYRWVELIRER